MPVLALAAVTKNRGLGGLNNRHVFLTVLEDGKFKIKVLADAVSRRAHLLVHGLSSFHCVLTV